MARIEMTKWVAASLALLTLMAAPMSGSAIAEDGAEPAPPVSGSTATAPPKREKEDQFADFARKFEEAIDSIDKTNRELERVLQQQPIEGAIVVVDELMSSVRTLEDRLQPGNATEQKIDRIVAQIDAQIARITSDDAVPPALKQVQGKEFKVRKDRYLRARADLSSAYENVRKLAEELKGHRRIIAYTTVYESYDKGAESLEATIANINRAVSGLRAKLDEIRPALTN
jgi:hypothetical protein